jgi:hypothetical protein
MSKLEDVKAQLREKFSAGINHWGTGTYGLEFDSPIPRDRRFLETFSVESINQIDANTILAVGRLTVGLENCRPSQVTVDYKATLKFLLDEYEVVKIINNRVGEEDNYYIFYPF